MTYSRVVTLFNNEKGSVVISIYPNPVYDNAVLSISSVITTKINLVLYDASGQKIKQWSESITAGNSNLTIHANDLHAGIYMLSVNMPDTKQVIQFIKR